MHGPAPLIPFTNPTARYKSARQSASESEKSCFSHTARDLRIAFSRFSKAMARHLHFLPIQSSMTFSTTGTVFFIVVAILAVVSLISFLCTSHHHRHSQRLAAKFSPPAAQQRKLTSNISGISGISSKALLMAKMISWRKPEVSDGEGDEDEGGGESEEAIWKKTIMMGERCRPLDFSGRILYDSQGNRLPEVPKEGKHQMDVAAAAVVP